MDLVTGTFHALLLVLVASGIDKLRNPSAAGEAMRSARLVPGNGLAQLGRSRLAARALGSTEVAVALFAMGIPLLTDEPLPASIAALAVGLIFVGFSWFVTRLMALDGSAGCGCFGAVSAPPGPSHVWMNVAASTAAFATAIIGLATERSTDIGQVFAAGPAVWLPYLVVVALAATLVLLAPALTADLDAAVAGDEHEHRDVPTFAVTERLSR